jgi:hypothetical protein
MPRRGRGGAGDEPSATAVPTCGRPRGSPSSRRSSRCSGPPSATSRPAARHPGDRQRQSVTARQRQRPHDRGDPLGAAMVRAYARCAAGARQEPGRSADNGLPRQC